MTERDNGGRPNKVARLIDRHDLEGVGEELEALWTADNPDERRSLRDLADYLNQEALRSVLRDTSVNPVEADVKSFYEVLVDAEASTADRTRVERRLERDGVDIKELRSSFVTYQSVRRYLQRHRGAEHTTDNSDQVEHAQRTIQRLRSRTAAVTESKVDQCRKAGALTLGENVRATVDVRVTCEDCGAQFRVQTLFDGGGCECTRVS
jgi:hypothetical protein